MLTLQILLLKKIKVLYLLPTQKVLACTMEGDWEKGEARTPVRISINFILITIEACRGYCLNIDLLYSGLVNRSWEIHHKLPIPRS